MGPVQINENRNGNNSLVEPLQDQNQRNAVRLLINGKLYTVSPKAAKEGAEQEEQQQTSGFRKYINAETKLVDFIRDEAGLKGTKWSCREGGCGACVCTVKTRDSESGEQVVRAVNSCLTPILSCDGWDISTVEHLGNKKVGYHPIQKRLAHFGGTQCGFCTSGMVMNMHALTQSKPQNGFTQEEVEGSFDGNICRCTGYRPILDAFKSFSVDADPYLTERCKDIEDFCDTCPAKNIGNLNSDGQENGNSAKSSCHGCAKVPTPKTNLFPLSPKNTLEMMLPSGGRWIKVVQLSALFSHLKSFVENNVQYRIVAGNTGTGVFKNDGQFDAYLDINNVPQLDEQSFDESGEAVLGANLTLSKTIEFLEKLSKLDGFSYAAQMKTHIKRVANTPVRNVGTIAGNLMMKHAHNEFPSDIFVLLEAIGAKLEIASSAKSDFVTPSQFLNVQMKGKILKSITLPKRDNSYIFTSFKITQRHQNAHAYVNAAFLFKVDQNSNSFKVLETPAIVFGGIGPDFVHASKTEAVLKNVKLGDINSIRKVLDTLNEEVEPDHVLPDATQNYRKSLTLSLLYKTILRILGDSSKSIVRQGAFDLSREIQKARQHNVYEEDAKQRAKFEDSPLYKPVLKLETAVQCSGEAEYTNDVPRQADELFGVFVRSTVAKASLKSVDASNALKIPGVVAFLTVKDIPGKNSFYGVSGGIFGQGEEPLFVEKEIGCSGQAIGLLLAENEQLAEMAAKEVKVEYENVERPIVSLKEEIKRAKESGSYEKLLVPSARFVNSIDAPNKDSKHRISGQLEIGGQAHFHMEPHVSLCIPKEDGLLIYSATQWMDGVQGHIALLLNIPNNTIDVICRRLGGGFGGKITRSNQVACASALGCFVLNRPVRVALDMETNLEMSGKRLPYHANYEVGFDDTGKIDALSLDVICDPGMVPLDATSEYSLTYIQTCYAADGWSIRPGLCLTNTHTNTFTRAPGSTQAIAIIETVIEHIADTLGKDGLEIRGANYLKAGDNLLKFPGKQFEGVNLVPSLVKEMKRIADYDNRKKVIQEFNEANRWRKRGLAIVPMRYYQYYAPYKQYPVYVVVHHQDGSVSASVGGIEMGQGLNTKVAQTIAQELGIPLSKIQVKPSNNLVSANSAGTGAAVTSELSCHAALEACRKLKELMAPVKKEMTDENGNQNGGASCTWEQLVKECFDRGIDLKTTHLYSKRDGLMPYDIYGVNLVETEIDVLTGEYKIRRLDLIQDAGKSLSPVVDLGQIEGAIVMGLGLWTEEKLVFDPYTGRLLTRNTWEYKVPLHKSTPDEMNITIMRKAENPYGVLSSKATGEPAVCLGVAVLFALKNAIKAARKDSGNSEWFQLDGPVTPEDVLRLCLVDPAKDFII